MISPIVIDAAVWALLGYSEAQNRSLKKNPRLDWSIDRTWTLSVAREQVALALKAAVDIFPTEQAAEIARLRQALLLAKRLVDEALPKFEWGKSSLDANAITLLNETPAAINAALRAKP
jgi:hypothetical protein